MSSKDRSASLDTMQPRSLVSLQTLIYFDSIYLWIYFILELFIFFYKGYGLFYPSSRIADECVILGAFFITYLFRIHIGTIGNKTESSGPMILFLVLSAIHGFLYGFFFGLQSYVLLAELIIGVIGLVIVAIEFLLGVIAVFNFKNFEKLT